MMKKTGLGVILAVLSLGLHAEGHYVAGVEGVKAASVPPPGTYYLGYLVHFGVDSLVAPGSDDDIPGSNDGAVIALANRVVHITKKKFLGADYGVETIIPIVSKDLDFSAAGYKNDETGLGDIYLGPLVLGWHAERWDAVAAAGFWLDNADSDELASPGNGYTSIMLTGGATVYLDSEKSLSAAGLMRYETHSDTDDGFEPGDQMTLEWGIGKKINPVLDVGLVGYDQWQMTDDEGKGATNDKSSKHAVGAEVSYLSKGLGGFLKAAFYTEYGAEAGSTPNPTGNLLRFTLIKPF